MEDSILSQVKDYPRFNDGRIDYTHVYACFAVNCVVLSGNRILMTYRGPEVIAYPNTLSGVSGFIDDLSLSIEETAKKELSEEVGAPIEKMSSIKIGSELVQVDETLGREWHVFPVLVEFDEAFTPTVNWENRSAVWQDLDQLGAMQLMPGFQPVVEAALALRDT